jgi:hypothetical protein
MVGGLVWCESERPSLRARARVGGHLADLDDGEFDEIAFFSPRLAAHEFRWHRRHLGERRDETDEDG